MKAHCPQKDVSCCCPLVFMRVRRCCDKNIYFRCNKFFVHCHWGKNHHPPPHAHSHFFTGQWKPLSIILCCFHCLFSIWSSNLFFLALMSDPVVAQRNSWPLPLRLLGRISSLFYLLGQTGNLCVSRLLRHTLTAAVTTSHLHAWRSPVCKTQGLLLEFCTTEEEKCGFLHFFAGQTLLPWDPAQIQYHPSKILFYSSYKVSFHTSVSCS